MLVDTNLVSELMRARAAPGVVAWAEQQETMSLSVVTLRWDHGCPVNGNHAEPPRARGDGGDRLSIISMTSWGR